MGLSFVIYFVVGRIVKAVVEKQRAKTLKNLNMPNPRGGNLEIEFSDDTELSYTILSCIAGNQRYLVKDPTLIKMVFDLVKAKIKKESVVLTPNMIRFLALKFINNDQTLIVKIGNIIASSNNRVRLFTRVAGSAMIGLLGALVTPVPYCILMMLFYYNVTEHCAYKCSDYFEQLPNEGHLQHYGETPTGHLFIGGNDDAKQVAIYIPSQDKNEVAVSSTGELTATRTYKRVSPRVKQVKFSDFKETDPVLSSFKDLEEPEIPQNISPINRDGINIDILNKM